MSDDDLETRVSAPTPPLPGPSLVFAHCRVDTVRRELHVHGRAVAAQPLVYALLMYLVKHPGRVIPKDELLRHVWRSPVVTDSAVTRAMTKLRRLLDDTAGTPLITTVHTVGYRFDATVRVERGSGPAQPERLLDGGADLDGTAGPVSTAAHAAVGSPQAGARAGTAVHALLPMQDAVDGSDRVVQEALVDWLHRLLRRHARGPWVPMPTVRAWNAGTAGARDLAEACRALGAERAVRCIVTFEPDRVLLDATWGDDESTAQYRRFAGRALESVTRQLAHALTGRPMDDADAKPAEVAEGAASVFWQQQCLRCFALEQQGLDEQALALLERCLPHLRPNPLLALLHVRLLHRRLLLGRARETALAALHTARHDDDTSSLVALHTELADIALKGLDLAQADHHCGLAEQAAAADVSAQEALPQILQIHATVHNLRGERPAALPLLERAREIARASGNVPAQLRALAALGNQWLELGRAGDAEGAFRQVIAGAAEADLPGLEAEGYRGMSELYTHRRALALAVDTSRKASTLSRLAGDARCRQLARSREIMALTDAGLLEPAAARLADVGEAHADEALTFAAVRLAWRQGDLVGATARWQQLFDDCRTRRSPLFWTTGAGLLRRRVALGQIEAARLLREQLARDPDDIRRIGNAAVVAHAEGRLATSIAHLREIWAAQGVNTPAGQDAALNLAWLLVESGHLEEDSALERDVQAVSTEYEPARIVQHVMQSRWGSTHASVAAWRSLVDGTPGLARRHGWLGGDAAMPRSHTPARRTLPELLCEACL